MVDCVSFKMGATRLVTSELDMSKIKVTVASLESLLIDPQPNLERAIKACEQGYEEGARIVFLPELMLTGHGGHPKMIENAQPVPDGPLCQAMLQISERLQLCICVGIAEKTRSNIYNSQIVVDGGTYLGLQRKIYLSMDEYCFFAPGQTIELFDLGDIRFGVSICYDNCFPEMALIHALNKVDLILSPHAGRVGVWPDPLTDEFRVQAIENQQKIWRNIHITRAIDHNVYVLLNNAVGPSTTGLKELDQYPSDTVTAVDPRDVVANHAGTVMGVDPTGDVFLKTSATDFVDEIVTVELDLDKRVTNHRQSQNRQPPLLLGMIRASVSR